MIVPPGDHVCRCSFCGKRFDESDNVLAEAVSALVNGLEKIRSVPDDVASLEAILDRYVDRSPSEK